jgi:alkaline phosphatase
LRKFPAIIQCSKIKIAVSGNRPSPEKFISYPSYIYFDGVLNKNYSANALSKIIMLSDNFKSYSLWNGKDSLAEKDWQTLHNAVEKAHRLKKKVRFWNAPDNRNAWETFIQLQVDYINTDNIAKLAAFLNRPAQ